MSSKKKCRSLSCLKICGIVGLTLGSVQNSYGNQFITMDNEVRSQISKSKEFESMIDNADNSICFFGRETNKKLLSKSTADGSFNHNQGIGICDEYKCVFLNVDERNFSVLSEYDSWCSSVNSIKSLSVKENPYGIRYLDIEGDR